MSQVMAKNPGIINGPLLRFAHWGMTVKNLDPSTHRLYNAAGLAVGLFSGRQAMNVLTGATPSGDELDKDSTIAPLRPLHGILRYDHFSDASQDRYMKVVDNWAPALLGGFGAYAGSYHFGMEQPQYKAITEAEKNISKLTLDKVETIAKFRQGEPWRRLAGATSMFGSASGFTLIPGLNNYGSTLGNAFMSYVPRDKFSTPYFKPLQRFLCGNNHYYPYSPPVQLGRLKSYLLNNPDKHPEQARAYVASILEPFFGAQATPDKIDAFMGNVMTARNAHFVEGKGVADKAAVEKALTGLLAGEGFERHLKKIGLDPRDAAVGRNGFIEWFSRAVGWAKEADTLEMNYKKAYAVRNKVEYAVDHTLRTRLHPHDRNTLVAGGLVAAAGALFVGNEAINARRHHKRDNEALFHRVPEEVEEAQDAAQAAAQQPGATVDVAEMKQNGPATIPISTGRARPHKKDDKLLGFLEWTTQGLNSPETFGTHRFSCAVGLSTFGLVGMKIMEAMTGRDFGGNVVPIDRVPEFMRGIYKKLDYNPHSDRPKDKWMFVLHFAVPSMFAAAGIVSASKHFFRDRTRKAQNAEFIDDFEDKATQAEAGPWTLLATTSSLIATPSGSIFLPIPGINYGMSLGTRFTLSSGRKMIFPGVGEAWTGTASKFSLGPTALRDYMIKYAANNKSEHPELLEEMAIGILKPLFADLTGEQVQKFVDKVEADRELLFQSGGTPEDAKKNCEAALSKHFKGAGLEETLRDLGFDPLKAHLGNNGLSGQIAQFLGAGKKLEAINQEFAEKYTARLQQQKEAAESAVSVRQAG